MRRPAGPPVRGLAVFAVEDSAAQLTWSWAASGVHEVTLDDRAVGAVAGAGAPGAFDLHGLAPDQAYTVRVGGEEARFRTLPPPPGAERGRFATLSDLHLGERDFAFLPRVKDAPGAEGHTTMCVRAALAEALGWGAELIVLKGDLAHDCSRQQYDGLARLLEGVPVPVLAIPGNHDGGNHAGDDPVAALGAHGIDLVTGVAHHDLPGGRVVVANTLVPRRGYGRATPVLAGIAEALSGAPGGAVLAVHHHPQRTVVPTHWPPGILGIDGHRFLATVQRSNPATLVTAGHTHRHRRRRHGTVAITEVGAPIHYPGTWGGYVFHDGGVRQVVRRVADPAAIAWTERTGRALLGQWGRWADGRLADRCFSHPWPAR